MIAIGLVLVWLAMLAAGATATGKAMRRGLVEGPARWCNRWTRGQLLTLALVFTGAAVVVWLMEQEGMLLLAIASPELMMLVASIELTTLVDVIAAAVIAASSMRLGMVRSWVVSRLAPRGRAPRARRVRRAKPPANDDEGPWRLAA